MNSVLSILQSIVYTVHSLSTDLNRKFVQHSVNDSGVVAGGGGAGGHGPIFDGR